MLLHWKKRDRPVVRTVGRCRELTTGGKAVGHEALEEDGVQVGTAEVDGGGVSCWARTNDHLHRATISNGYRRKGRAHTTLECIFELLGTAFTGAIGRVRGKSVRVAARGATLARPLKVCDNLRLENSVEDFIRSWWSRTGLANLVKS